MTVMTSPDNAAVECLSFADLYALTFRATGAAVGTIPKGRGVPSCPRVLCV